jgi:hypothetical protein
MNEQCQCLEINVHGEAFPLRFKTKQEVNDWITQEGQRWRFLNVESSIINEFSAALQNIKNQLAAIPDGEFSIIDFCINNAIMDIHGGYSLCDHPVPLT